MKGFKTIALLFIATVATTLFVAKPITAKATTHCVFWNYEDGDTPEWRYVTGIDDVFGPDFTGHSYEDIYYLRQRFQNGDTLVVQGYGENGNHGIELDLKGFTVGEIVYKNAKGIVVYADHVNKFSALTYATGSVHGDVDNAYIYDDSKATFYNNVGNLYTVNDDNHTMDVTVIGTVSYLEGTSTDGRTYYTASNFRANTLKIENGTLTTNDAYYTKGGSPVASDGASSATASTATNATAATTTNASDGVKSPKTSDNSPVVLLIFALSAIGMTFSVYKLRSYR